MVISACELARGGGPSSCGPEEEGSRPRASPPPPGFPAPPGPSGALSSGCGLRGEQVHRAQGKRTSRFALLCWFHMTKDTCLFEPNFSVCGAGADAPAACAPSRGPRVPRTSTLPGRKRLPGATAGEVRGSLIFQEEAAPTPHPFRPLPQLPTMEGVCAAQPLPPPTSSRSGAPLQLPHRPSGRTRRPSSVSPRVKRTRSQRQHLATDPNGSSVPPRGPPNRSPNPSPDPATISHEAGPAPLENCPDVDSTCHGGKCKKHAGTGGRRPSAPPPPTMGRAGPQEKRKHMHTKTWAPVFTAA